LVALEGGRTVGTFNYDFAFKMTGICRVNGTVDSAWSKDVALLSEEDSWIVDFFLVSSFVALKCSVFIIV